jgi:hypothetical protein
VFIEKYPSVCRRFLALVERLVRKQPFLNEDAYERVHMPKLEIRDAFPPGLYQFPENEHVITKGKITKGPYLGNPYPYPTFSTPHLPNFPGPGGLPPGFPLSHGYNMPTVGTAQQHPPQSGQGQPTSFIVAQGNNVKQMLWPTTRGTKFLEADMAAQVRAVQRYIESNGQTGNPAFRDSLVDTTWYTHLALSVFTTMNIPAIKSLSHADFFTGILRHLDPGTTQIERTYATAVENFIQQFSWCWEGNPDNSVIDIRKYLVEWQALLRDSPPSQDGTLAAMDTKYVHDLVSRLKRNTRTRVESNPTRYSICNIYFC